MRSASSASAGWALAIAGRVARGRQHAHRLEPNPGEGGGACSTRRPSGVVGRRDVRGRRGRDDDARERRGAARGRARPRGYRRVARQRSDARRNGNARGQRRSHVDGRARGCRPDPRRRSGPRAARRRRCGTAGYRRRRPRGCGSSAARPLFEAIGRRTFEAGARPESATAIKLANNFVLGAAIEAMAEAFALVRSYSVEPALLHEVLTEGLFAAPAYKVYGTDHRRRGLRSRRLHDRARAQGRRPDARRRWGCRMCRCRARTSSVTASCPRSPTATATATGQCSRASRRA